MNQKAKKYFVAGGVLGVLFVLFTILVATVDVQPIGPEGTEIGFAAINKFVFEAIGVHLAWYEITDLLGKIALLLAACFALVGAYQFIKRKSIRKVDKEILLIGVLYVAVVACYVLFELFVINYRPVILETSPEASYPSSHTMLTISIVATAYAPLHSFFGERKKLRLCADIALGLLMAITVVGRLISGVHWFTDIVGGVLLALALVMLYWGALKKVQADQ